MATRTPATSTEPYEELADLFIGGRGSGVGGRGEGIEASRHQGIQQRSSLDASMPSSRPSTPAPVTVLMPVNVPVASHAWVEQAAAALARRGGPLVLARREREEREIALLCFFAGDPPPDLAAIERQPGVSLDETCARLQTLIRQWVVEARGALDLGNLGFGSRARTETPIGPSAVALQVIFITGADQAARVAVYERIKQVAYVYPTSRLGLIVVGSAAPVAAKLMELLGSLCRTHLGRELEPIAAIPRIEPVGAQSLGRFSEIDRRRSGKDGIKARAVKASREDALVPRCLDASMPRCSVRPVRLRPRIGRSAPLHISARFDTVHGLCGDRNPLGARVFCETAIDNGLSGPLSVRKARIVHTDKAPKRALSVTSGAPLYRPMLIRHVAGVTPLDVRCPAAPEVELAFDANGVIHGLASEGDEDSPGVLASLLIAMHWANEHREILSRLHPAIAHFLPPQAHTGANAASEASQGICGHLFTARPAARRRLADGAVRVHALIPASTAGPDGLVHVEIS